MSLATSFPTKPTTMWDRGGEWRIEPMSDESGDATHLLTLADPTGLRQYDPIKDGKSAFLAFARLRDDIWKKEDKQPAIETFSESLLGFIKEFGPPLWWGDLPPNYGFTLEDAMQEARLISIAVRCYRVLSQGGPRYHSSLKSCFKRMQDSGEFVPAFSITSYRGEDLGLQANLSTDEGVAQAAKAWLVDTMNMHPHALPGVRLQHQYSQEGNWEPGYHYDSLVNVMWLQLHLAMLAGSLIRDCLGCGVTFEATRSNQTFHDSFCRGATNSRRTYKRNKIR